MNRVPSEASPKYLEIYRHLQKGILTGEFGIGYRIPTEMELASRFDTSRVTVARAIRDLVRDGLVVRRRGSGSFVCQRPPSYHSPFLIVSVSTSARVGVVGVIAQEVMRNLRKLGFGFTAETLTPADFQNLGRHFESFCQQIDFRQVKGLFLTPLASPLELMSFEEQAEVNRRICDFMVARQVSVVLIDRDILPFPQRSPFDLITVDNAQAGHILTRHLLNLGYHSIHFIAWGLLASHWTVGARIAGYRQALLDEGITPPPEWIHFGPLSDPAYVRSVMADTRPEAFVCANDSCAAHLMRTLNELKYRVPTDVAVVGIDDDEWGNLLAVPLTTFRQPAARLGAIAAKTMLDRLAHPEDPPRTITITGELVVRESCGTGQRVRRDERRRPAQGRAQGD